MSGNFVLAGGSTGIGLELIQSLLDEADQIDVYSRTPGDLPDSPVIRHHECNFADPESPIEQLPESITGAVYCPGTINLRSFRSLKPDNFRDDFEVNVVGAVRFLQACYPALRKANNDGPASVLMFSTVAVSTGMPMHASVAAAKGAIEGLTRSLAAEWAPDIRVNCLAPALTDTPLAEKLLKTDEARAAMAGKYPLSRIGQPGDLASLARFLLLPDSSWITGQIIGVDGGMSAILHQPK